MYQGNTDLIIGVISKKIRHCITKEISFLGISDVTLIGICINIFTADAAKKAENAATNDVIKKYNQSVKNKQGSLPASPSQRYRRSPAIPSRPPRKITSKIEASVIIQKAWRRHIVS